MALARRRQFPFLVLAPALVVMLGLVSALAIALVGLSHLSQQSERALTARAELLGKALGERLSAAPAADQTALLEQAAIAAGVQLLLLDAKAEVLASATAEALTREQRELMLERGHGSATLANGAVRYFVQRLGADGADPSRHALVVLIFEAGPAGAGSLIGSVAALTAVLVGIAALVAFALARDVHSDVTYVRKRIVEMATNEAAPAGTAIPVRSTDQVGLLTRAFNVLVDRFAAAEQAYRQDLAGALAYDRDRTAFLAALSHELRTPLNAILGFTEVLLSEVDGPLTEDARENLEMVRRGGEHLRALIGDILDLSALESGELELSPRPVDVYGIAVEVAREARIMAYQKRLVLSVTGESARAWADPLRVRQVLTNVIGNAVKFTLEGSVGIQVQQREGFAAVIVDDTGPGIAADDHAAIFEEYRQSGDLAIRRIGTGLGLAITRRLVRMHCGWIEVESQLGKGSRFTIVLPSEQPGEDLRTEPVTQRPAALATDGAR